MKGHPQPGPQYYDSGYKLLDLGSDELKGKGEADMAKMIDVVRGARGCE